MSDTTPQESAPEQNAGQSAEQDPMQEATTESGSTSQDETTAEQADTPEQADSPEQADDEEIPSTEELEEPSTEKDPGEEPKAPKRDEPEPDHEAVGIGIVDTEEPQAG